MKTTCVITEGKYGKAYRGEILEDGILVGTFHQLSPKNGYWPLKYHFYTSMARDRFEDLADTLTIQEIIEAMLPRD